MKTAYVLLTLALLSGCTMRNFNRGMLAASHVTLACDYGQTVVVARNGWKDTPVTEGNPVLGVAPSPMRLTVYDTAVAGAVTGSYLAISEKWRWFIPLVVTIVELQTITMNTVVAPKPWCGVR